MGCFFCFLVAPLPAITTLEIDNLTKDKKMDGGCGSVSMDRYWNMVATPLLFIVIGIGLFVLFQFNEVDVATTKSVLSLAASLRRPDDYDDGDYGDDGDDGGVVNPALRAAAARARAAVAARRPTATATATATATGARPATATAPLNTRTPRERAAAAANARARMGARAQAAAAGAEAARLGIRI